MADTNDLAPDLAPDLEPAPAPVMAQDLARAMAAADPSRMKGCRHRRERGSGSVWTLAAAAIVVMAAVVSTTMVAVVGAGRRADTAADLAALSAAAVRPDQLGSACVVADRIVVAHQARLVACAVEGNEVAVTVEAYPAAPGGELFAVRARARAGPTIQPP
ncbi:helicase/secretion neighborhood TadE-like protein [Actinopolymorpha cephalotaxi]|uniref:Helicase/secretion neighborhood TadE-like protein n=1 Tax=Actinopolymorpha cephalotaxi TaxID=504797 RepID=A0A1I2N6R5_9ACTN|nr:Rv3654c family TadE-like protein [Actinopolymorpha cephalotaxi]NYH85755.1 secretion/DNA translocation related TadE-like protein [Actinopolymorpha cephalotaxi]SFF97061.1 helicase/secretion neighborhood TadE-like protein [Actinopolymorpha cephalotaxi]